jgi:hypothetical protein
VRFGAILVAVVSTGVGSLYAASGRSGHVKQTLTATAAAPSAHGKARVVIRSSSKGKFSVAASRLAGGKTFDVIVGGVKVGELHTNSAGRGRALFSTAPGNNSALLGFDPRGDHVLVRDEDDGDDVLVGDIPDDGAPGDIACCFSDDGESECEQTSAAECTAKGGTPVGVPGGTAAASCLPNPCATTPPPAQVVCCKNATEDDESEAECEQVENERECADDDGMVVQAASCDPNPCQAAPPADASACCVTQTDDEGETEAECRVISADACQAAGGSPAGVASCSNDPCGGGDQGGDQGGDDGGDDDGGGDHGGGDHGGED